MNSRWPKISFLRRRPMLRVWSTVDHAVQRQAIQSTHRLQQEEPTWRSVCDSSSALDNERSESIVRSASSANDAFPGSTRSVTNEVNCKSIEKILSSRYPDALSDVIVVVRWCGIVSGRVNSDWICSIHDRRRDDGHSCEFWDFLWWKRLGHRCDNGRDVRPYGFDSAFSRHFDRTGHVCKRRIHSNRSYSLIVRVSRSSLSARRTRSCRSMRMEFTWTYFSHVRIFRFSFAGFHLKLNVRRDLLFFVGFDRCRREMITGGKIKWRWNRSMIIIRRDDQVFSIVFIVDVVVLDHQSLSGFHFHV